MAAWSEKENESRSESLGGSSVAALSSYRAHGRGPKPQSLYVGDRANSPQKTAVHAARRCSQGIGNSDEQSDRRTKSR